jgi:hypothetical protein
MMQEMCRLNEPKKVFMKDMKVELYTGDTIWFLVISDYESAWQRLAGREFQWVDLDPDVSWDQDVIGAIKSRIRTPSRLVKEVP